MDRGIWRPHLIVAAGIVGFMGQHLMQSDLRAQGTIEINISPEFPVDLPPLEGRENHTLQEAAIFAWQQFIAATWPAKPQDGSLGSRDEPDASLKYGDQGADRPVVWETYRHKSEIFPGQGAPNGYDPDVSDEQRAESDYGYDELPKYVYMRGEIDPAEGQTNPAVPPYNNLDEVDEISLCDMHAGISGSDPENRVLYQAKANRVLYKYIAKHELFKQMFGEPGEMRRNAVFNLTKDDPSEFAEPYIKLPSSNPSENQLGAIEIKAAWRRLNTDPSSEHRDDPSRFYTAPVRFYVDEDEGRRFKDSPAGVWGLIGLHIIHKTKSSPTFVYTTFEQVDNIRAADGTVVEEPDGALKPEFEDDEPFTPLLTITESKPPMNGDDATGQMVVASGEFDPTNSPQLYYKNKGMFVHGVTTPVAVNRRLFTIPEEIAGVNRVAQKAIRDYEDGDAVWQHYKLVNVQALTLPSFVDRSEVDTLSPADKASYYMANIVVEDNVPLQQFSGGLSPGDDAGADMGKPFERSGNSDYALLDRAEFLEPDAFLQLGVTKNEPIVNTYVPLDPAEGRAWDKFNMGGCLGCHGGQGQTRGGDFSVIVARGRSVNPEVAGGEEMSEEAIRMNLATGRNAMMMPMLVDK